MIVEVRTYRMKPGSRSTFIAFFQREAQPRMEALGMTVVGAFASLTDPDVFTYVRTFESLESRESQYRAFYRSEDWLGWMIDEAIGHEESFEVFLGVDDPRPSTLTELPSGVHSSHVTVSAATGVIDDRDGDRLSVRADDGSATAFRLAPAVTVSRTPTGRGLQPAEEASVEDLDAGRRVLVLADSSGGGDPLALQVVLRD